MTRLPAWADYGLLPALNIALAFLVTGVVVAIIGENPVEALATMVEGAFLFPGGIGYTLFYATNFIFTGLAVAVAYQARLFNIGAEGQAALGGIGAAAVALSLDQVLPGLMVVPLAIAAAAAAGLAWAIVPGWLQAYRGSHIVITTIMFNTIAAGLTVTMLAGALRDPRQPNPQTRQVEEAARLPAIHDLARDLGLEAATSPLTLAFPLALLAAVLVWVLIFRTRWGYALRVMGQSEPAAVYAGIPVRRLTLGAMAVSGALAGLMAVNVILGDAGRLVINFTAGYGFTGIAVALMGRAHPVGVVLAALLFGALFQGGTELDYVYRSISREMVLLIQGLIILFCGALSLMLVPWVARALAAFRGPEDAEGRA
ncbi:MAG: ABC transporter permease [Pseudomonadota bacterium]